MGTSKANLPVRTKPTTKIGRPSSFHSYMIEQVYKLALLGATDPQLADFFDVTRATINNWKNDYPEFLDALKRGKGEADAKVAEALYHRALGYSCPDLKVTVHKSKDGKGGFKTEIIETPYVKHYPPDTTACIFWLKNRQRQDWRDVQGREHTGKDGGPIQLQPKVDLSDVSDEYLDMIEEVGLNAQDNGAAREEEE